MTRETKRVLCKLLVALLFSFGCKGGSTRITPSEGGRAVHPSAAPTPTEKVAPPPGPAPAAPSAAEEAPRRLTPDTVEPQVVTGAARGRKTVASKDKAKPGERRARRLEDARPGAGAGMSTAEQWLMDALQEEPVGGALRDVLETGKRLPHSEAVLGQQKKTQP